MDKTHNISLGGMAFLIDDNAYSSLKNYLNQIRFSLNNASGIDEIISDVEYRMAELLRERLMSREVVNQTDVDYLIGVMGKPEDYYSEEFLDDDEASSTNKAYSHAYSGRTSKKLFRDPDDKMLGGVCSGIGHYTGIDATWVRIITVILLFVDPIFFSVGGTIFIAYFILWLVVPEAKTTSDKLQMRGEPVNFDSIKDFFGNSPETVRNNIQDFGNDARRVANDSGSVLGNLLRAIVKIIGFFFLGILLIIALSLLISFFAVILGLGGALFGVGIAGFSLNEYFPYVFEGAWEEWVAYISLGLVMVIPAIALILAVLRLISKRYRVPRAVGFALPFLWLVGLIGLTIVSVTTLRNFRKTATEVKTVNVASEADTYIVQMDDDDMSDYSIGVSTDGNDILSIKPGYMALPKDDDIRVKKSETGNAYLKLSYVAKGKTMNDAVQNLKTIQYNYEVKDSLVRLDDFLFIKEGNKWRNQRVRITFYLPEGKNVMFRNIDDVESYQDGSYSWHDVDSNKIYTFEENLLTCTNCPEEEKDEEENDHEGASINISSDDAKVSAKDGVIKIIDGKDSVIIKTTKNGTGHISISHESDSISD